MICKNVRKLQNVSTKKIANIYSKQSKSNNRIFSNSLKFTDIKNNNNNYMKHQFETWQANFLTQEIRFVQVSIWRFLNSSICPIELYVFNSVSYILYLAAIQVWSAERLHSRKANWLKAFVLA